MLVSTLIQRKAMRAILSDQAFRVGQLLILAMNGVLVETVGSTGG